MSDSIESIFGQYGEFLKKLDDNSARILAAHGEKITCSKGCAECCIGISVMPVEFHAMKKILAGRDPGSVGRSETDETCVFLDKENSCMIYDLRPVICRTHGYPLYYMDRNDVWKLTYCGKNFRGPVKTPFAQDNVLNLEGINLILASLNRKYCTLTGLPELERIPLSDLAL
jgi:uncharacterized protein